MRISRTLNCELNAMGAWGQVVCYLIHQNEEWSLFVSEYNSKRRNTLQGD